MEKFNFTEEIASKVCENGEKWTVTDGLLPMASLIQCIQVLGSGTGGETTAHTCMKLGRHVTHTLTPRLRLRRQCILGLEAMKSLRRFDRGSLCCLGDWGSLGTAEGEGRDEAGGAGGGWWGDVNRDISYQ